MNSTQHLVSFTSLNYSLRFHFKAYKRVCFFFIHVECSEQSTTYKFFVHFFFASIYSNRNNSFLSFTWFKKDQSCDLHVLIGEWILSPHSRSSCQKQPANHRQSQFFFFLYGSTHIFRRRWRKFFSFNFFKRRLNFFHLDIAISLQTEQFHSIQLELSTWKSC